MSTQLDPLKTTAPELHPKIIIVGDSWGCGEWIDGSNTHRGLEQYLLDDGYEVINLSIPAGSNKSSLQSLKNFLIDGDLTNLVKIFYFWTEWHRDLRNDPYYLWDMVTIPEHVYFRLEKFNEQTISRIQFRLLTEIQKCSRFLKTPIGIIGGCSDIINIGDAHPGVYTACQSLVNLCINSSDKIENPIFSMFSDPKFIIEQKKLPYEDFNLLLKESENGIERRNLLENYADTWFSDGCHGNKSAHQKLFNFLKYQGIL